MKERTDKKQQRKKTNLSQRHLPKAQKKYGQKKQVHIWVSIASKKQVGTMCPHPKKRIIPVTQRA